MSLDKCPAGICDHSIVDNQPTLSSRDEEVFKYAHQGVQSSISGENGSSMCFFTCFLESGLDLLLYYAVILPKQGSIPGPSSKSLRLCIHMYHQKRINFATLLYFEYYNGYKTLLSWAPVETVI